VLLGERFDQFRDEFSRLSIIWLVFEVSSEGTELCLHRLVMNGREDMDGTCKGMIASERCMTGI